MKDLLETVTTISQPLGLGGLVAAILFLFLRHLVNRGLLPKVTKAVGARLLKDILQKLFNLSALAIVLGFLGYIATLIAEDRRRSSQTKPAASPPTAPQHIPQAKVRRVLMQVYLSNKIPAVQPAERQGPVPFNFFEEIRSDEQLAEGETQWIRTPNRDLSPRRACPVEAAAGRACILDSKGRLRAYLRETCETGEFEGPRVLSGCSTAVAVFGKPEVQTPLVQCCFYEDSPASYKLDFGASFSDFAKAVSEGGRDR